MKEVWILAGLLAFCLFPSQALPVETAPRITDREIVEKLTRLEEGQKALGQRIDELRQTLLWGLGVMFAGMFALMGLVIWDSRSALAPAVRQMEGLREREEKLEAALREYASRTPELAESLKKWGFCEIEGRSQGSPLQATGHAGQIT